ncbi:MAG: prenyltransferase/squalene oxidase repeat-containing protein [Planctomycetota bacterium]
MARQHRSCYPYAFTTVAPFDEQLRSALKEAPWWMISIALHVLVGALLLALDTSEPEAAAPPLVSATMAQELIDEIPPEDDKVEDKIQELVENPQPVDIPEPEVDVPETDNDLPTNEVLGNETGLSDAPFEGPSKNSEIGIGPGAGGRWGRGKGGDDNSGGRRGGGERSENAVDDALKWLAAHQSGSSGGWEAAGFMNWCDLQPAADGQRSDGAGKTMYDAGVTGLALCAFLGAGYTNRGDHEFARTVSRGLKHLKDIQDPEGCFGPRSTQQYIYNHATASLAMVEAYGMTGSPIFKAPAQRALDFIALARNPYFAWRYGIKPGDNDTSVTGWMMMALKSAKLVNSYEIKAGKPAPLSVDDGAFDGIRTWLDKVTDPNTGRVGYLTRGTGPARPQELIDKFPADKSESMTGVGVLARVFSGEDVDKSDAIKKGAELCAKLPPTWNESDGSIDMYYWYYATLAMFQVGGKHWDKWKVAMDKAIVDSQRRDTDYCQFKGSWDPIGPWGPDGGRVYSTAILAMCLEVYYRYPRVAGTK